MQQQPARRMPDGPQVLVLQRPQQPGHQLGVVGIPTDRIGLDRKGPRSRQWDPVDGVGHGRSVRGVDQRHIEGARAQLIHQEVAGGRLHGQVGFHGIPQSDRHKVFEWSNRMIGREDPEYGVSEADAGAESLAAATELFAYAAELGAERLAAPQDDIITKLLHAEVDGEKLTHDEFIFFFLLLAVAGNETTRNLMSGGMVALGDHPDQYALLNSDRERYLDGAVEEMLRYVSPVISFRRTATRDVELHGAQIREGDDVVIFYGSGNRDEAVYADPDRFDITRSPNDHLAFGGRGPHHCLGANLAREEIRIMFDTLFSKADIEIIGPPQRLWSNLISGIKHLPVRAVPR
mgnify:CR=1 FL=1